MNHLQVATEEALEVTGVTNNQAGLRNPRAISLRPAALTGAAIAAAVGVADFRDLLAEIEITVEVAIPPVDLAGQEDSDNPLS